jgi:putative nucleotidyltransferase with HDIG domain
MLKRIDTRQVRTGMFIEAVEAAWHEHSSKKRRFLVSSAIALEELRGSNATTVVINTSKGIDVGPTSPLDSVNEAAKLRKLDAAAARQTVRQSSILLGNVFANVCVGETVSLEDSASIVTEISKSLDQHPAVFISVTRLKSKDETTFVHSIAVSALMIHFGRYLGLDKPTVELLGIAGLLHDIGKIEIPRGILNKKGALDAAEMQTMRDHPALGHKILSRQADMPEMVLDVCLHHHQWIDGRGYPDKLAHTRLSFFSRLAAICDVYDAVTSNRPYKKPWSAGEALAWMLTRDGQFDRKLLKKFALCLAVASPGPV